MCKETLIIEGVITALKGLAAIMDTTEDTGGNAELRVKIDNAIVTAEHIVNGESIESDYPPFKHVIGCLNPIHPHVSFRACNDCKMGTSKELCRTTRSANKLSVVYQEDVTMALKGWDRCINVLKGCGKW